MLFVAKKSKETIEFFKSLLSSIVRSVEYNIFFLSLWFLSMLS